MITTEVHVQRPGERLAPEEQLAWRLAAVAGERAPIDDDAAEMVVNRVIDDTAVALAALERPPVVVARDQATAHPRVPGATVLGLERSLRFSAEWAAWANSTAVRELDFHDTFLSKEYAHPGDCIPPLLAVAQAKGADGAALMAAIVTSYEIHVALAQAISLHEHTIDHVAHLAPAIAGGLGALLALETPVIYQAINQAVHTTTATRQSRKGDISSWKAFAPAFAGKAAIEAVDRAMRGQKAPAPIYEGEDAVIATLLDGPDADYAITLPEPGEARRAILQTFTKAHSAEYQAQAFIDLARRLRTRLADLALIERIVVETSHHTHAVIGSGAGDPEKYASGASRETLDHSLMYILAVALEDGEWHHERSYAPERARRPETVELWQKISTVEDPEWTRRYHAADPAARQFGGRLRITLRDGTSIVDELAVADAHPAGAHPFGRADYVAKFRALAETAVSPSEQHRFLVAAASLRELPPDALDELSITSAAPLSVGPSRGIF